MQKWLLWNNNFKMIPLLSLRQRLLSMNFEENNFFEFHLGFQQTYFGNAWQPSEKSRLGKNVDQQKLTVLIIQNLHA